jgi:hypothetical protein
MNERIQELLYKANGQYHGISALTGKEIINTEFVDYEKFAELIVRECMSFQDEAGVYSKFDMANAIARCFGVEE